MTEIYLIRHTQAEGNIYRMMQGHWDGGVTPLGKKQVECLAQRFENIEIDEVWSSDMYRTQFTASAISIPRNLEIKKSVGLRELNMGPWEAKYFADLDWESPDDIHKFIADQNNWYVEGAETYREVADRAYGCIKEIAEKNDGKAVAITSHGVTIRSFLSKVTGIDLADTKNLPICGNTAVSHLFYRDGEFTVDYMNDNSHLTAAVPSKPWTASPDIRSELFNPLDNKTFYCKCYEDTWREAHGNSIGFFAEAYYNSAIKHYRQSPENLRCMFDKDKVAGLLEMDSDRGKNEDYLWIVLLYMRPEYRGNNCGIQAFGRAVTRCRALGREKIRLNCAEENQRALRFYQKIGFEIIETSDGNHGKIHTMEYNIGRR